MPYSYDVNYRTVTPLATITVQADDYERAIHTAIEQINVGDGGEVQVYQTVLTPLGPDGQPLPPAKSAEAAAPPAVPPGQHPVANTPPVAPAHHTTKK